MLSGRIRSFGIITRPEESYLSWYACVYMCVCDRGTSTERGPWPTLGCRAMKIKIKYITKCVAVKIDG